MDKSTMNQRTMKLLLIIERTCDMNKIFDRMYYYYFDKIYRYLTTYKCKKMIFIVMYLNSSNCIGLDITTSSEFQDKVEFDSYINSIKFNKGESIYGVNFVKAVNCIVKWVATEKKNILCYCAAFISGNVSDMDDATETFYENCMKVGYFQRLSLDIFCVQSNGFILNFFKKINRVEKPFKFIKDETDYIMVLMTFKETKCLFHMHENQNNEKVYDVFKTPFHAPYENPLSVLPRMSMEITPDSEYPSVATPGYIKPPMTPLNESNILNEKPLWIGFLDWVDRLDVIIGHTFTNTTPKTRKIKIEMFCYKDDVFATPELFGDVLRMNFISRPMVRNLKNLLIGANRYLIKFHSDNSTEDIENILVTIKKFGAGYVRLNLKMSELGYLPTIVMVKENIKNQIFGLSPRNPKLFNNALAQIISMIKKKNVTNQSNVQSAKGIVSESTNQST